MAEQGTKRVTMGGPVGPGHDHHSAPPLPTFPGQPVRIQLPRPSGREPGGHGHAGTVHEELRPLTADLAGFYQLAAVQVGRLGNATTPRGPGARWARLAASSGERLLSDP